MQVLENLWILKSSEGKTKVGVCIHVQEVEEVNLPAQVHHVFFEVLQYVARCKLAILAAIKHAFCGIITLEIAKILAPALPAKHSSTLLSAFSLSRTLSDKMSVVSGTQPSRHTVFSEKTRNSFLAAVPEDSNSPKTPMAGPIDISNTGQNPKGANNGAGASGGTANSRNIEGLPDSAALNGLLEIIEREFQVSSPSFPHHYFVPLLAVFFNFDLFSQNPACSKSFGPINFACSQCILGTSVGANNHTSTLRLTDTMEPGSMTGRRIRDAGYERVLGSSAVRGGASGAMEGNV